MACSLINQLLYSSVLAAVAAAPAVAPGHPGLRDISPSLGKSMPLAAYSPSLDLAATAASQSLKVADAAGSLQQSNQRVTIEAGPSEIDLRNNTVHYRDVRITQGTLRLEAQEGSAKGSSGGGDSTEDSEWLFRHNVRITVEGGSLHADEARVTITASRMQHAVITGSPATFEKRLENGDIVHGRARTIEYDVPNRIVHLRDDAYLTDGSKEISHQNLTYSIAEEKVIANPSDQDGERVRITINPKTVQKTKPQ